MRFETAAALGLALTMVVHLDASSATELPFRVAPPGTVLPARGDLRSPLVFQIEETDLSCDLHEVTLLLSPASAYDAWAVEARARVEAGQAFVLEAPTGAVALVVTRCPQESWYAAHGPFRWRRLSGKRFLPSDASRTIEVHAPVSSKGSLQLVGPDGNSHAQRCVLYDRRVWECIGVPSAITVLALVATTGGLHWGLDVGSRSGRQIVETRTAGWGQMVNLRGVGDREVTAFDLRMVREQTSAVRGQTMRPLLVADADAAAYRVDDVTWWLSGAGSLDNRLVEVRGPSVAGYRLDLKGLVTDVPSIPFELYVFAGRTLSGVVTGWRDRPAPKALVSLFEYRDRTVDVQTGDSVQVRHWVRDTWSDGHGRFSIDGLTSRHYEIIAVHPVMGRAVLDWHPDGRPLSIRLQSTPRVRGRVMTGGVPVPGVSVRAVPDRQTFETAVDAVAIVAPAQVTAPGGQFDLAVPGEGGGQVVIGGPELGTVRIAYPDASRLEGMVELGDIELPSLVDLGVRFRPGCDVLSVGPIGELGVVVVRSVFEPTTGLYQLEVPEPGWWWLEAMCPESSAAVASRLVLVNHRSSLQPVDLSADLGQPR